VRWRAREGSARARLFAKPWTSHFKRGVWGMPRPTTTRGMSTEIKWCRSVIQEGRGFSPSVSRGGRAAPLRTPKMRTRILTGLAVSRYSHSDV
jgi:hypothetical protein